MTKESFETYKYKNTFKKSEKIKRLLWEAVYSLFFRTTPRWCLHKWRVYLLKAFGAKIGKGCKINPTCKVWAPWNLEMGQYSALGENVDCYSMDKIVIGSKVAISQRAFLCTGSHDIKYRHLPLKTKPIYIRDFAWVCAESFIGPGVEIGEGAVVAARSVVKMNIENWGVYSGDPARFIKRRVV